MRIVVGVFAALMTLGLAVFGVVAAQKLSGSGSITALAEHVMAPAQTASTAPAAPAAASQVAETHLAQASVIKVSDKAAATPSAAAAPAPLIVAQNSTASAAAAPAATPAPNGSPPPINSIPACNKPGGMGLSRIVQIDTTGGPAFGFEHFRQYDFLADGEVVLTFDDGPWPENTPMVLKALADNCLKATFFEIGEHASWHPELSREVAAAGMTIGSHTWSHKDLAMNPYASDIDLAKQEIEMGISAVHMAVDGPIAPFFRFPDLQQPPALLAYLGERNVATFSTDIDSFDFKMHRPEQVIESVMTKLKKRGKGILLMHDFQRATAEALPELLHQLKAAGFKVVHMVPKAPVTTLAKYDDMVRQQDKYSVSNNARPGNSVFHTIGEYVGSPAPGVKSGDFIGTPAQGTATGAAPGTATGD